MACGRCAKRVRAFCKARWARLRVHGAGSDVREKYSGPVDVRFGPTLAAEHLASEDGVTVHHDTLRRWMWTAGLWSRVRKHAPHRQRRERKAHFGELVQMDGRFHPWFEDRGPQSCLLTLVDDATGKVPWACFREQEDAQGYFIVMRVFFKESKELDKKIDYSKMKEWKDDD